MTTTHKQSPRAKTTGKVQSGFSAEKSLIGQVARKVTSGFAAEKKLMRQAFPQMATGMVVAGGGSLQPKIRHELATALVAKQQPLKHLGWQEIVELTLMHSGVERHNLIQEGLSTYILKDALDSFQLVPEEWLLHAIGLSPKTISRREETRLGPRHSDAAMVLIEVTEMANRVLGSRELAENWLTQPALALDGRRPLDLISSTPGIEAVKDLLTRMEYGVYA